MKFGLNILMPDPLMKGGEARYRETMELVDVANAVGIDSVWVTEHHFSNYSLIPSPLTLLSAIGQRAPKMRVGTGVLLLPLWNPVRAAADVAVLDCLTGGRVDIGIGRGYQRVEFDVMSVPMEENRQMMEEGVKILKCLWTQKNTTFAGQYYNIRRPVTLLPRPVQLPHPPIWVATSSPASIEYCAAEGYGFMQGSVELAISKLCERSLYQQQLWLEAGRALDLYRFLAIRAIMCTPTDAEAEDAINFLQWQIRVPVHLIKDDREVIDGAANADPFDGEPRREDWLERVVFGSPATCIEKILALDEANITHLNGWFEFGGIPQERALASLQLFGEKVCPVVKRISEQRRRGRPAGRPTQQVDKNQALGGAITDNIWNQLPGQRVP